MKRVFLSFRSEDRAQVNGVRLLAWNPNFDLDFYDESVRTAIDSNNAAYIRRRINQKIARTSVTICFLSELTHTSTWVQWELEESFNKGNWVLCMGLPNGPSHLLMPEPARTLLGKWWLWDLPLLTQFINNAP
jgi:hypothetical protein